MARSVDHHEQTLIDHSRQLVALLTLAVPGVGLHDSVEIKKRSRRVSKIKSALGKARLAFGFIPFEIHGISVAHWPTPIKTARIVTRDSPDPGFLGIRAGAAILEQECWAWQPTRP